MASLEAFGRGGYEFDTGRYTGTESAAHNAIRNRDADAASRRTCRHVYSYAKAALAMDERLAISVDN